MRTTGETPLLGLAALSNREKLAALDEALTVIRGVWAEPNFSETGVHHQAVHVNLEPKPRQHIPFVATDQPPA
jgi:alkanesulfonate monooxygenase SsuD/methylene tetrahydromethanopterin reductase-like flavin-dependent oxidoreductase (luciferase family)